MEPKGELTIQEIDPDLSDIHRESATCKDIRRLAYLCGHAANLAMDARRSRIAALESRERLRNRHGDAISTAVDLGNRLYQVRQRGKRLRRALGALAGMVRESNDELDKAYSEIAGLNGEKPWR